MSDKWPYGIRSSVPEGETGNARVERFTIDEEGANRHNLHSVFHPGWDRYVVPGTFTCLRINGQLVMSDTSAELHDSVQFLQKAHGDILIGGLGLGWIVQLLLCMPNKRPSYEEQRPITSITVVEISPNVLDLVGPHLKGLPGGNKVSFINEDALRWNPKGKRFTCAWWDIWIDANQDNKPQYTILLRRWGHRVEFQDAWQRSLVYERC